ncbi:hypothetical protein [Exiguobacterium sp. s193]|uniref:hypothetical protein n=1 Tax=Exiguobacterium sp. s193 TaxID=2751207 RepID=UPI001BEBE7AC|nr:hypothetical protein [Exiguobacterium sp. s193]
MIRSLSSSYDIVVQSQKEADASHTTRAQLRHAIVNYDILADQDSALQQLIDHELKSCCFQVQQIGLDVRSDLVKLLVLSAFSTDAGFSTDELTSMSSNTIKRHLSSCDAIFTRLIQKLFLHQSQTDIICQRLQSVLCGAATKKCIIRAQRLHESASSTAIH